MRIANPPRSGLVQLLIIPPWLDNNGISGLSCHILIMPRFCTYPARLLSTHQHLHPLRRSTVNHSLSLAALQLAEQKILQISMVRGQLRNGKPRASIAKTTFQNEVADERHG